MSAINLNSLDNASIQAIGSTISFLRGSGSNAATSSTSFIPSHILLTPPSSPGPSQKVQNTIRSIVIAANQTALANACSSVLAGATSESDDYGDVGFWLGAGEFGKGNEKGVIEKLGFGELLARGGGGSKIHQESTLPALCSKSPLAGQLSSMSDMHMFRIAVEHSGVVFFLVGKLSEKEWVGLVGAGSWS